MAVRINTANLEENDRFANVSIAMSPGPGMPPSDGEKSPSDASDASVSPKDFGKANESESSCCEVTTGKCPSPADNNNSIPAAKFPSPRSWNSSPKEADRQRLNSASPESSRSRPPSEADPSPKVDAALPPADVPNFFENPSESFKLANSFIAADPYLRLNAVNPFQPIHNFLNSPFLVSADPKTFINEANFGLIHQMNGLNALNKPHQDLKDLPMTIQQLQFLQSKLQNLPVCPPLPFPKFGDSKAHLSMLRKNLGESAASKGIPVDPVHRQKYNAMESGGGKEQKTRGNADDVAKSRRMSVDEDVSRTNYGEESDSDELLSVGSESPPPNCQVTPFRRDTDNESDAGSSSLDCSSPLFSKASSLSSRSSKIFDKKYSVPVKVQNNISNSKTLSENNRTLKFSIDNILKSDFGNDNAVSNVRKLCKGEEKKERPEIARGSPVGKKKGEEKESPVDLSQDGAANGSGSDTPMLWPAWVYCTRYSDRPSSGSKYSGRRDDAEPNLYSCSHCYSSSLIAGVCQAKCFEAVLGCITTAKDRATRGGHNEYRPITQQGVTGLRPNTTRGPQYRQVLDKRYYDGLIRMKMKAIADEVAKLNNEIEMQQQQQATTEIYEKRVREIATELTEFQGQLADYNLVVDKVNTNTEREEVDEEGEKLKFENDNLAAELDQLFGQNRAKEEQLLTLEQGIEKEKSLNENLIEEMSSEERRSYEELKTVSDELKREIEQHRQVLEDLSNKKAQYEDKLLGSQIRQEAVRLYHKLNEREERKLGLIEEEKNRATPTQEREQLLQKMKEDNAEMAAMERQINQISEQIKKKKEELELIEQDLEESQNDRHQKFKELKRREETMEQFMSTYEESKNSELKRIQELEDKIVIALEQISKNISGGGALPSRDEFSALIENLSMKQEELQKSKLTMEELTKKQQELAGNVEKVENLENKIQNEISTIREKVMTMTEEIKVFVDLDKLRDEAQERRNELMKEREELMQSKPSIVKTKEELQRENEKLLSELNENETYVQLNNLEKKLQLLEQNNSSIKEFIESKKTEMDYEPIKETALKLVNEYNLLLQDYCSTKGEVSQSNRF